jgi:hypothetical protein
MFHRQRRGSGQKRRVWRRTTGAMSLLGLGLLLSGCAPTFSDLQSARLAGKGRIELTPSFSSVSASGDEASGHVQNHFGGQVATGVSDKVDLRVRYEYVDAEGEGIHILGMGPKFSLVPDRAAFYLPVGTGIADRIQSGDLFQIQPTFLYTQPVNPNFELTGSGKAILWVDRDVDDLVAFNLGAGISSDLQRWAIRPEGGILINPGEDGRYWHFSLGFTYYADRGR